MMIYSLPVSCFSLVFCLKIMRIICMTFVFCAFFVYYSHVMQMRILLSLFLSPCRSLSPISYFTVPGCIDVDVVAFPILEVILEISGLWVFGRGEK